MQPAGPQFPHAKAIGTRWLALTAMAASLARLSADPLPRSDLDFFEARIRPVLVERCYECHSTAAGKSKGGLLVDSAEALRRGGDTRPAVVPGDPGRSLLIEAVHYGNQDLRMPPKGRLPASAVADLTEWIRRGAPDPRTNAPAPSAASAAPAPTASAPHWAFVPPAPVAPPKVDDGGWGRSPIDAFIWEQLAARELLPAPPADRPTLLRRLTYDLTGLPPTPGEIDRFVADTAPGAVNRVIDRLLESPHYGERWGRHWLDLARYADTNGQDENKSMSHAWRYRDYVINAFNADKPYDQFIREQLAGDLLPPSKDPLEMRERAVATGFLVLGPKMLAEQDKQKLVMDVIDEQIDVVSRAFLGLTVSCSRCHDHKFDPVLTRDYYSLAGIFKSTRTMGDLAFVSQWNERQVATAAELARWDDYRQATNAATRALADARRATSNSITAVWRDRTGDFLLAARRVIATPGGSRDTQFVASVARQWQLPAANLQRWIRHLEQSPDSDATLDRQIAATADPAPVPVGGRVPGPGRLGPGLRCTGSNHVTLAHTPDRDAPHLTVEAWVRLDEPQDPGDSRRWVVNKNGNEWREGHYALMIDGRRAGAYLNIGGGRDNVFAVWSDRDVLPAGEWRHLAFTYNGADLRLYVNGKASGQTHVGRTRVPGADPVEIGRRQDGYNFLRGSVDEVRIHRRALAAAELRSRQDTTRPVPTNDVVAACSFDPETPAERALVAQMAARELFWGEVGLLRPAGPVEEFCPPDDRTRLEDLARRLATLQQQAPPPPARALAVSNAPPVEVPVHIRGSHLNLARTPEPRGFIRVIARPSPPAIPPDQSGRRELADWLTHPEHPLTARVFVNRVWQGHFGAGLVRTPDNFGLRGEAPTHPALLDWLAREFIRQGWSVKQLHQLILQSSTYQMSTDHNPVAAARDPDNRLLWRMNRRRLEAEAVRDGLLAVSGQLDRTLGGTLVNWINADYTPPDTVSATSRRRAVYLPIVRDRVYDMLTIFDFANPSVGTGSRTATVVSHQALFFLNSPLVKDAARHWSATLPAGLDDDARLDRLCREAWGRPPRPDEADQARRYLARLRATDTAGSDGAWAGLAQAVLAANQFLYLD